METIATGIASLGVNLLKRLVTEKFLSRMVVLTLKALSKSTKNTVDDDVCKAVGDALGNPCD
jgi:hypothetical protein